ncbi:membrane dipeptidase [Planosporangium flavigriseum]|uniref:membrane dipeptidase n=1 Tax=Planosporangium flavigriseum TaxID=373681 RepID=UPI00143B3F05|nr:membrane dipeptidase [Planosporangium flavigriseum]NJC65751.1 membrane dipeptidase [Planosporangium flavigriseum]
MAQPNTANRGSDVWREDFLVIDGLQITNWDRAALEELRTGGVSGVNATCAVWEGPTEALRNIGDWYQLARKHSDLVTLASTVGDIVAAKAEGRIAVLLGFQNTSPFADDYTLVEVFHRLGVRIAQLTYNIQNVVGGACYDPEDSGLTRFGRNIVAEMNRVGMLVDLSHVGNRTCRDAIDASATPVAITHANPTWFFDTARNKPADVIKALVDRGGILGCCLYPNVLGGARVTREQFCEMVVRLVDEIGIEHVAIGSDCARNWDDDYVGWLRNGRWQPPSGDGDKPTWPSWPSWFTGPEDFPTLTEGLFDAGLNDDDVARVLGGNWLNLFETVFEGSA